MLIRQSAASLDGLDASERRLDSGTWPLSYTPCLSPLLLESHGKGYPIVNFSIASLPVQGGLLTVSFHVSCYCTSVCMAYTPLGHIFRIQPNGSQVSFDGWSINRHNALIAAICGHFEEEDEHGAVSAFLRTWT